MGEIASFCFKIHLTIDSGDNTGLIFYSFAALQYFSLIPAWCTNVQDFMRPSESDWQAVAGHSLLTDNCLYDLVFPASELKLTN